MGTMRKNELAEPLQDGTPKLIDPGEGGWASEPKVTTAESLLYGNHAGIVRLLGQAAVDTGNAYSLACKRIQTSHAPENDEQYEEAVQRTWQLYTTARTTHRLVAEKAIATRARCDDRESLALTSGLG